MEATLRAFLNIFPQKMKKRTIWYLFDRYLGHFLREKLTLDQLSIDLIDGKGCINELDLDVDSLNEELSFLPVKFVDGCFIEEISVYVPWSSLLTESCSLQIKGAAVYCQLDHQLDGKNNQMESDYLTRSIMSSSMQLAEEIVQTNEEEENKFEGLEIFAQLIDSVLRRIELVAIDTRFILRSKRKQARNPATTKVARGSEDYCDLEIKVGHLRCEENAKEEEEDEGKEREDVNVAPKTIRKKLTITDIEIFMDGDRICTLKDTHVMEVNVKDARCDIQVYLASILTGILKKNQINELINLASPKESGQHGGFHRQEEKVMTAVDYARIEQQLKMDSARFHLGSSRNNLTATLLGGGGGFAGESSSAWTSAGDNFESCETTAFMPIDYSNGRRKDCERKEKKSFQCAIKLPGLALCLVGDSNYSGDCAQISPKANTLDEINCALDKVITCQHIRLITVPIQMDLGSSGFKMNSGDIWIAEQNQRGLCPYIWTEGRSSCNESVGSLSGHRRVQSPSNQDLSFQCVITNEKIEIGTKNSTNLIVDPTLLERIERYFPSMSDGSSSSGSSISIVCPEIRGKLLIPVADLRIGERPRESELRPFWIEFEGSDLEFTTNTTSYDVSMSQLILSIGNYTETKEIGRMTSAGSTPIRLNIKKGADASTIVESTNVESLLEAATMTESIFICTKAQAIPETPFQVKTKIMRSENKGDAKTLVPNDGHNSRGYFETCKSFTQLQVELSADNVNLYFETKEQIDLLYNALGNDLALWTPMREKNSFGGQSRVCPPTQKYQSYFPCGTGLSDSMDSESSFHSIDGSSSNQRLHNIVTCLLRCDTLKVAIGDHLINSANVFIGLAFGLQDDTSNVISVHGSGVSWSFNDETVIDNNHLCQKANSLDLTFEIDKKEVPVSKSITVAIKLSEAILFKTLPEIFVDFWSYVNVTNDDVLGYTPPKIQTELHTTVVNGAISYGSDCVPAPPRPVLITFDGITVTAMVVEDTSDTLMRFIIEEAAFYFKKNGLSSKCLSNYVCIIDSGLIDLSLKLCEANRIVFKAMNNAINVRACSDSLAALCQFVTSLINQSNESKGDDDPPSYSKAVEMRKGSNTELIKEVFLTEIEKQDGGVRGKEEREAERERERKDVSKKKEAGKKRKDEDKKKKGKTKDEKEREKEKERNREKEREREERVEKSSKKQKEKIMATIDSHGPSTSSATGLKKGEMTDSGFWLLGDDDIGAGIKATDEPIVRILNPEPIIIMDNFFTAGKKKEPSELLKSLVARYFLEEMTLCLSVYGGRDFEDDQGGVDEDEGKSDEKKANVDVECRNRGELKVRFNNDPGMSEDPIQVWESINLEKGSDFVQATSSRPVAGFSHSRKTIGGRLRKNNVCVQLQLTKVRTIFDKFTDSCNVSWRWSLFIKAVEIRDCLSVSNINKMLYEYISEDIPRRNNSSMISIRAKTFRNQVDSHEECDLRVSLKPLRVNIDQDTIMFLFEYFSTLKSLLDSPISPPSSGSNTPSPIFPSPESDFNVTYNGTSEETLTCLLPEDPLDSKPSSLFVKSFEFTSTVLIRLDYHGKRIDFEQGTIQGLLMGLGHLNHSELYLKRLHQKRGILGVDRVIQFALTEWFEDIKRNQIPRIIGSIGPLNSVRQLFQGVIDLFWIPVDQYRRDRRIFRGIQRGASSFSSSTATAMLDLANRLVYVIQGTAQFAHDVVLTQNRSPQHNIRGSVPTSQPRDLREGVASAYTVMREGLNETYRNVANAGAQADGVTETVGVLIGSLPSNILHPIIKATEATSNVIVGMRNQLTPEARQDDQYKWKTRINNQQ